MYLNTFDFTLAQIHVKTYKNNRSIRVLDPDPDTRTLQKRVKQQLVMIRGWGSDT